MKHDEIIKLAAHHYSITSDGELSRDSTPYPMNNNVKMGVGFDTETNGYKGFKFRLHKGKAPVNLSSHRMVFYLQNGYLPEQVDHIDRDRSNNHPSNLRAATPAQNSQNTPSRGGTSKFLGVHWCKARSKWQAFIRVKGKKTNLGRFKKEDEAASHYNLSAMENYGEFANLNDLR